MGVIARPGYVKHAARSTAKAIVCFILSSILAMAVLFGWFFYYATYG